ncbi:winged helix-turn-helix transcriptional regulator [Thiorhodovibrio frisius]|uniref:Putative transcriptional regulator n=1 Tax=Thiorhodovibrio frisius TaxID=631362 RepID=H8Z5U9_9GAMM|nr:helix-turn-helix domain-containing protein [Thiorhodovibrio frisius]EIC19583.1 putative transcriptional regulator [Thiorhodovibrio frisius]WPL20455.1 putative HTH-type transcriptional regulator YybR [Thiorhodovibrio frisius]
MQTAKAVVELQPDGRKSVFNTCFEPCPIERGMRIIGGKWKGSILWHLQDGPVRFNDLARQLGGASKTRTATTKMPGFFFSRTEIDGFSGLKYRVTRSPGS